MTKDKVHSIIGWREWMALPKLGIKSIKVKVDTGAKTSALDVFDIEEFKARHKHHVRFKTNPVHPGASGIISCSAEVIDKRWITDSSGHKHHRFIIMTIIKAKEFEWEIELSLANREKMNFRMLLGRSALTNRCLVHPGKSFLLE